MKDDPSGQRSHVRSCLNLLAIGVALAWLLWLIRGLISLCRTMRATPQRPGSTTVPAWHYRQPDPLIYSQPFLHAQSLAVTWNNPDITLEHPASPGTSVNSYELVPDTDYVVIARIWNNSTSAPAVGLPVHASYLEFGIGTIRHEIGSTTVDLPVKGAAGSPAFAQIPWKTPATPGHYCLQIVLEWTDDAEPGNNLGQHNVVVAKLNSPHATTTFPLRNETPTTQLLQLLVDAYVPPQPERCSPDASEEERKRHRARAIAAHNRDNWPVPEDWTVELETRELQLEAGQTRPVTIAFTAPDGFHGRQQINVTALAGNALLGGVTVAVEGSN